METIDALIMALNGYNGGVIVVSHDQRLLTHVCDELWLCKDQGITRFRGDFNDYKEAYFSEFSDDVDAVGSGAAATSTS